MLLAGYVQRFSDRMGKVKSELQHKGEEGRAGRGHPIGSK